MDSPTRINQAIAFIGLQIDEISSYSSLQIDILRFTISLQIGIEQAIVLYDGNVEEDGKVLYLPVYMAMFI